MMIIIPIETCDKERMNEGYTLINLYRLFSNLTRFSSSSKFFSKSVGDSVMADVERRRNLFDTTRVASDSFDHAQ